MNRPTPVAPRRSALRWIVPVAVLVLVALVFVFGIRPRMAATAALKQETQALNVLPVSVVQPKSGAAAQELVLPGNVQAFIDTPIYARTNGYVKRWHADIGAHVKAGELLAEIDTPEVDDQLQQARADLATAQASFDLASTTAARWQGLLKANSVSQQETEEKIADQHTRKGLLDAARFNVARLEKLQSFKRIYAPFAGVVTARNVDVGALIDAGSGGGPGKELFHLAATDRMRVYVSVPQAYSRDAAVGTPAELSLAEFPDKRFKGTLTRTTRSIDASSRTLLAEIAVDNAGGELLPGAYAQVHLKLKSGDHASVLPINALLFRAEGMLVAVVQPDQRVALVKVVLGRDFGTEVEIVSGLKGTESVILNPSDSLTAGTQVNVVQDAARKPAEAQSKP